MVQVEPGTRCEELHDAVARVEDEACAEDADRLPVGPLRATREVRDAGDQEEEVDAELEHPLPELRRPLRRVEVEEADEVDEQERGGEDEHDPRRPRQATVPAADPVERVEGEEEDGEDVGEADCAGDVPVDLLEGNREERGKEEEAEQAAHSARRTSA